MKDAVFRAYVRAPLLETDAEARVMQKMALRGVCDSVDAVQQSQMRLDLPVAYDVGTGRPGQPNNQFMSLLG